MATKSFYRREPDLAAISVFLLVLIVAGAFLAASLPAQASGRAALIVDNGDYRFTKRLPNTKNDANLLSERLASLGFKITRASNQSARDFAAVINEFAASLNKDTVALFYYAGHGLQYREENYILGVDAKLRSEADLQFDAFKLNLVLRMLEDKASMVLAFWDACRDNPLSEEFTRSFGRQIHDAPGRTRSAAGAAPIPARRGDTLVVFAAEPGKTALDGTGQNSPFAAALGRHVVTRGIEIEAMLKRVTTDVRSATGDFQSPERLSRLSREFYFAPLAENVADSVVEMRERNQALAAIAAAAPQQQKKLRIVQVGSTRSTRVPQPTVRSMLAPGPSDVPSDHMSVSVAPTGIAMPRRLKVSPDGAEIAIGDDVGGVWLFSLASLELTHYLRAHNGRIRGIDFSGDGSELLTAGGTDDVKIWDRRTGQLKRQIAASGTSGARSLQMSLHLQGRFLIMGDANGVLHGWDLKTGRNVTNLPLHSGPIHSVAYQPGGEGTYLSAGADGLMQLRMPQGGRFSVRAHSSEVFDVGFTRDGTKLFSVGGDKLAKIWDAASLGGGRPARVFRAHAREVLTGQFSPNGNYLATGGVDKIIYLWDVNKGVVVGRFEGHGADIEAVAFNGTGDLLFSASEDHSLIVWSVADQEPVAHFYLSREGKSYFALTNDGARFGDERIDFASIYLDDVLATSADISKKVPYLGRSVEVR